MSDPQWNNRWDNSFVWGLAIGIVWGIYLAVVVLKMIGVIH